MAVNTSNTALERYCCDQKNSFYRFF